MIKGSLLFQSRRKNCSLIMKKQQNLNINQKLTYTRHVLSQIDASLIPAVKERDGLYKSGNKSNYQDQFVKIFEKLIPTFAAQGLLDLGRLLLFNV